MVTDCSRQSHGLLAHGLARCLIKKGRWRFLDDLLVAALDRALSLAKVKNIAVLIAQHLNFDMARLGDEFLDEDAVVPKGRFRLVFEDWKPSRASASLKAMRMPFRRRRPKP